jgi:hypothetical protein
MPESINYKYLGTTVVFLLLAYYYLYATKQQLKKRETQNVFKDSVRVLTKKGEIYMDPNIFEMHMSRVKENIISIHKNFDKTDCSSIKAYLDDAKINIEEYIKMNVDQSSMSMCEYKNIDNIFNDNILQESEILKHKLANITERDDKDNSDEFRYKLLELILDMDIIMFLIKTSLCKNGSVDLSALDKVVLELYRTNCVVDSSNTLNTNILGSNKESFTPSNEITCPVNSYSNTYDEYNTYHDANVNQLLNINSNHNSRCVPSQYLPDTTSIQLKEIPKRKPLNNNNSALSHSGQTDVKYIQPRLGKRLETSDMYKNSLGWRREFDTRSNEDGRFDGTSRTSLLD